MQILKRLSKRFLQSIVVICSLCCSGVFAADKSSDNTSDEKGFFSLSLKSLQSPTTDVISHYKNKTIILSFFEPDCSWCYRQITAMEKSLEGCADSIQILLIGIHGTRQALQRDLRRTKSTIPSYEASQALLALTGNIDATPMTFIINTQGAITHRVRGYSPNIFRDNALCPQPIAKLL